MAGSVFRFVASCSLMNLQSSIQFKSYPKPQTLIRFVSTSAPKKMSNVTPPAPAPDQSLAVKTSDDIKLDSEPISKSISDESAEYMKRVRRRKVVIMLSYCGQGYFGMQRNPETRTIEEELFTSFLKNKYFDEESFKKPQIAQFQRAARTDKNVSAARQIVSVKIAENISADLLNEHLPPEIRVMGIKRVTQGFDSKKNCDARTYMYMTPSFAFAPVDQAVTESYRITPERIEEIQKALNLYLGPKNFHNFTSRKRPHDPSAIRNIYSFTCSQPFEKDGLEYLLLRVKGQSFMLHQIRKMIGLVMAYMRGFASLDTFNKCWTADRIDVPKAPGVGLILDHVHYERYDKRFGSDGIHDPLIWDNVEDKVQKFCDEFIYPVITKTENVEKSMMSWLTTLPYHTYDVREDFRDAEVQKADISSIGKAFRAIVHATGEEPEFCNKKINGREDGDGGSSGEDDENDEDVRRAKKQKIGA